MGIEPTSSAWKAEVLPLNYTRLTGSSFQINSISMVVQQSYRHTRVRPLKSQTRLIILIYLVDRWPRDKTELSINRTPPRKLNPPPAAILVEGVGFEPTKA